MFLHFVQDLWWSEIQNLGRLELGFVTSLIAYLSWRAWAFTIRPALHPEEPKQVPYAIPFLGHAISFFRDSDQTCTKARLYMGDTREPFGLVLAGEQFYIITSPQDVTTIYNNKKTLTFDEYIEDMIRSMGSTPDGLTKLFQVQSHLHKNLAHAGEDLYRNQWLPGPELDVYWPKSLRRISQAIERLQSKGAPVSVQSVLDICGHVLLRPVLASVFGDIIFEIDKDILASYTAFDDASWKINYKIPWPFSRDVHRAKNSMIETFTTYVQLADDKRRDASWFTQNLVAEMKKADVQHRDIASFLGTVAWAALSNAYKLAFWMWAFALFDSEILGMIQEEVRLKGPGGLEGSEAHLENTYPYLISFFNEALRMTTSSASVRNVASPTRLGKYTLPAGSRLLLPFRQLHMNEGAFGADTMRFNAKRFFNDQELVKNPSFRPFGGGVSYCPGRYLARREVVAFMVLVLLRYDIRLAGGTSASFPRIDEKKPSLGILAPVPGEDMQVELIPRA